MANKFNLDKVIRNMRGLNISLDLANTAKNEFLGNFRNQGFNGQRWQEVKRRSNPSKSKPRTQAILQGKGSGKLRKDVANSVQSGRRNSNLSYTLVVENEYARVHNEGLKAGRGKGFIMPKRQFIGNTQRLNDKLLKKIQQKTRHIWAV
jgi:phage gpG-like protein